MDKAPTCAELWARYWADYQERTGGRSSSTSYSWKNLAGHFGHLQPSEIQYDHVQSYVRKRRTGRIGRVPGSSPTIRRELAALLAALRWCAHPKRKMLDPDHVPAFDLPADGLPRQRWLTNAEIDALHSAAREMRGGAPRLSRGERFLWLALETAARKEAILDLTWDRVDFELRTIDFNVPGRRLTKKRRVVVPISSALLPVLQRAFRERLEPKRRDGLVMDNRGEMWATIQSIAIKAGLAPAQKIGTGQKPKATGISPHVFRHTAATHMARQGMPLWIIGKVLGNSLPMVERVYAKFAVDDLRAAVECVSNGAPASARAAARGKP